MKLYYRPKTSGRPMRAAWVLEEIGVEYEAIPVDTDSAEHQERSLIGRVPVLEFDDGSTLNDSTAIVLALADLYPDAGLLPPLGSADRGLAYQWALTAQTELEKIAISALTSGVDDDTREQFRSVATPYADALRGHEYLVADSFGADDIVTTGVLFISERSKLVSEEAPPRLQEYFAAVGSRPALARAAERCESLLQPAELLAG